jgi:excisionase family DNA binding protein
LPHINIKSISEPKTTITVQDLTMPFLSLSQLRVDLPQITEQVYKDGVRFIIHRGGEPIFGIVPIKDMQSLGENIKQNPNPDLTDTYLIREAANILKIRVAILRKILLEHSIPTTIHLGLMRISKDDLKRIQEYLLFKKNTISLSEAAKVLHAAKQTIQKLISKGVLKTVDVEGKIRIPKDELERIEEQNELLTIEEAAKFLNKQSDALLDLVCEKKIKLQQDSDGFHISKYDLRAISEPESKPLESVGPLSKTLEDHSLEKRFNSSIRKNLLSLPEAANFLGISRYTVQRHVHKGSLKSSERFKSTLPKSKYKYLEKLNSLSPEELKKLQSKKTLTVDEAALLLRVSRTVLDKRIHSGSVKVIRIGKRVRISNEELKRIMTEEPLLTIKEAADLLNIPPTTLKRLIHQEKIHPARKGGGVGYRISKDELSRFVKENQTKLG